MTRRAIALALTLTAACGGGNDVPADVIDREAFITTYVDLRLATLETPDFRIPAERRAEILANHGVDGESLLRFAEVHGRDLDYMNEVWTEVETRMQDSEAEVEPEPAR